MKKIKIIDLLNKIANGEEVPEKFRFAGLVFERKGCYIEDEDGDSIFDSMFTDFSNLNDEVEILEEKKLPEKLSTWFSLEKDSEIANIQYANHNFEKMYEKINEICDYLKSKEKGE